MPRILFAVHTPTVFIEPFRSAKLLAREGMEPMSVFAFEHWSTESFAQDCNRAGILVHRLSQLDGTWNRLSRKLIRFTKGLHRRFGWWGADFLAELLDLHASLARVKAAFDTLRPDLLVMSIDLAGYDTGAYVAVAHQRGCKVLLISSMMSIGLDQAEVYYHNRDYHVRSDGELVPMMQAEAVKTADVKPAAQGAASDGASESGDHDAGDRAPA